MSLLMIAVLVSQWKCRREIYRLNLLNGDVFRCFVSGESLGVFSSINPSCIIIILSTRREDHAFPAFIPDTSIQPFTPFI